MTPLAMTVLAQAEKLPPIERIELIERLFFSLDSTHERRRIDSMWAEESESRLSAYERGEMEAIPVKEVFRKLETGR